MEPKGSLSCSQESTFGPHPELDFLYPSKRLWSDVSQMLFDQGVDPTPLLRRSKEEGTALKCNCYRFQLITFISEELHKEGRLSRHHSSCRVRQMISGCLVCCLTAWLIITVKSNIRFNESYERFTISWQVQRSPVSLSAWTWISAPQATLRSQGGTCVQNLRTMPLACVSQLHKWKETYGNTN